MVYIDLMPLKRISFNLNLPSEFPGRLHLEFEKISPKIKWPNKVTDFRPNLLSPPLFLTFLTFVNDGNIYLVAQGENIWGHP